VLRNQYPQCSQELMLHPITTAKITSKPACKSAPHQQGALAGVLGQVLLRGGNAYSPILASMMRSQGLQIKALNMLNCLLNCCPSSRHASLRSFEYARRSGRLPIAGISVAFHGSNDFSVEQGIRISLHKYEGIAIDSNTAQLEIPPQIPSRTS